MWPVIRQKGTVHQSTFSSESLPKEMKEASKELDASVGDLRASSAKGKVGRLNIWVSLVIYKGHIP